MRNVTKSLYVFFVACMSVFALNAQTTDVTDTYLGVNAGFNTDFNFDKNTFVISGNQILNVAGWMNSTTVAYTIAATVEYGIPVGFNGGTQPPSVGYNNSTGGALALSTGWGESLHYYKNVTLPAGKYAIVSAYYNTGSVAAGSSLTGWIPNDAGKGSVMSSVKSFPIGAWVTDTIEFVINDDDVAGKIQVGLQSIAGTGSGNTAKILVDYVKLLAYNIDKTALAEKISEVENLDYIGSPGETFIADAITAAKAIYNSPNPTLLQLVQTIEGLDDAVALFRNSFLSDLKIDGTTVFEFNPEKYAYTIVVGGGGNVIPQISATAVGAAAGANVVIEQASELPGKAKVTILPGSGKNEGAKVYTVDIIINYLAGWDASGATDKTPYDAGWRSTDAGVAWADSDPIDANKYQYRDNLGVGRVFIHPQNHAIFSYPVVLEKGKAYILTCSSAKMSGDATRPTTFSVNSSADGTGETIGTQTLNAAKWGSYTNYTVNVVAPADGTYYVLWQTAASDGDRSLAFNFMFIESGTALEIIFDTDGGTPVPETQYKALGAKITKPQEPTKDGFLFDGWWYEEDGFLLRWNFDVAIGGNTTLYAKWLSSTFYEITFDSKGGSDIPKQEVREGNLIEEPFEPTMDGYEFLGWFYNDTEWNFSQSVTSAITLEAKWRSTSSINEADVQTFEIRSILNGITIITDQSVEVKIVSVVGVVVKTMKLDRGDTFIQLPAGVYIVNGEKVMVK